MTQTILHSYCTSRLWNFKLFLETLHTENDVIFLFILISCSNWIRYVQYSKQLYNILREKSSVLSDNRNLKRKKIFAETSHKTFCRNIF